MNRNLAKLAHRLNWPRRPTHAGEPPRFYLLTDIYRLPDPTAILHRLPRGAAVVVRHTDPAAARALARRIVPRAHALGLKVLLAGTVRAALACGCDGVHLSERCARRGPPRIRRPRPGFLITAAAHGPAGLAAARRAGADAVMLSPVFATESHPGRKALGAVRFARLLRWSSPPVVALGGLTPRNVRRLHHSRAHGLAAIGGWRT